MEWLIVALFGFLVLIWSVLYLFRKLLKLRPLADLFQLQLDLLLQAKQLVPELAKPASAIGDDPVIHVAWRLEHKRKARRLKRERSRRLRTRGF